MVNMEKYYTVQEVSRMLGLSKQTLVRYEEKGVFPKAHRNKINKWREYTLKDINYLRKILGRVG